MTEGGGDNKSRCCSEKMPFLCLYTVVADAEE